MQPLRHQLADLHGGAQLIGGHRQVAHALRRPQHPVGVGVVFDCEADLVGVGLIHQLSEQRVGYLDQHTVLEPGMSIRDVLASAFSFLFEMETRMNEICDKMADADEAQMEEYMEELGTIQDMLTVHDFYMIDSKVEEIARAFGLSDLGLDRDVTDLSGGQRTKVLLAKLLLEKPDILLLDEPTNYLDAEHIEWLKRYLNDYENAFILISHDMPFLNSVVNLIYHNFQVLLLNHQYNCLQVFYLYV